jgi:hypothetical protein
MSLRWHQRVECIGCRSRCHAQSQERRGKTIPIGNTLEKPSSFCFYDGVCLELGGIPETCQILSALFKVWDEDIDSKNMKIHIDRQICTSLG